MHEACPSPTSASAWVCASSSATRFFSAALSFSKAALSAVSLAIIALAADNSFESDATIACDAHARTSQT